jgi:hypothetical protein
VSSLWIGEYQEGETGSLAEFAVADAILGHTDLHAQGMRPGPARARLWTKLPVRAAGCSGSLSPRWGCPAARRGSVADGSVDHVSMAGGATGAHHRAASPGAV